MQLYLDTDKKKRPELLNLAAPPEPRPSLESSLYYSYGHCAYCDYVMVSFDYPLKKGVSADLLIDNTNTARDAVEHLSCGVYLVILFPVFLHVVQDLYA